MLSEKALKEIKTLFVGVFALDICSVLFFI